MENGASGRQHSPVGYVFSRELLCLTNQLPEVRGRALLVHQLIGAYGLLRRCAKIEVTPATDHELRKFHSQEYVDFVHKLSTLASDEYDQTTEEQCEAFGLSYDCPPVPRLHQTISHLAGSSICAAKAIVNKQCSIVLNWSGGWHHGKSASADGFCYSNDIVFCILTLLENGFRKVLYVDLDLHHGNGVEDAFVHTDKVVTLSIHKRECGFYPGTGDIQEIGLGKGKYHCINMPLSDGIDDEQYIGIFDSILTPLVSKYKPQVILCQCGADTLAGDRMHSFNLTLKSYEHCVQTLLSYRDIPKIFLGGGGYKPLTNTARLWTAITAICTGTKLDTNIPDHNLFLQYGPTYELSIDASTRPNHNSEEEIERKLDMIHKIIAQIKD